MNHKKQKTTKPQTTKKIEKNRKIKNNWINTLFFIFDYRFYINKN